MRAAIPALIAVISMLLIGGAAGAEPARRRKKVDSDVEDVSAVKSKLAILTDGEGIFIAVDPSWGDQHWLFFGDGKTFWRLRVSSAGADGSQGTWSKRFWSPRVDSQADIEARAGGKYLLSCAGQEVPLKRLPDGEAARMVDQAAFKKALWRRQAHFLARDEQGNYYYVDRLRDEHGGKGHRIFVGPKGGLKELPMTNIVSDSVGEIYATRKGELRFVISSSSAQWIKGPSRLALTIVPVEDNVKMIYGDLGVYEGTLGTPCDDL